MISYAQNHEDVLLARALGDAGSGFYIDVGAYDPTQDSVTRHFYDRGWRGINIEPQPALAAKLRDARPRDVTLQVALSDHSGTALLYDATIGDGVATIDEVQVGRLRDAGQISGRSSVPVTTLAAVCAQHCDPQTPISFLKVDVEGHEREVLAGADWSRWRPRIVVVEATEPNTTRPSHQPWEPILLAAGYVFVQFDGLNRWYAWHDEPGLVELLRTPVNVLDAFAPYRWTSRIAELEALVASLTAQLERESAQARLGTLIRSLEDLQERYALLSAALERERSVRAAESQQIDSLTRALQDLRGRFAG